MDKNFYRKKGKEIREQFTFEEVETKSEKIFNSILNSKEYNDCNEVFVYVNMANEVITDKYIKIMAKEKNVAIPLCERKGIMNFYKFNNFDELEKTKFGTYEHKKEYRQLVRATDKTLIIVPGLLFDKRGYRVGYGGGFYDRYLSKNNYLATIGVTFSEQLFDEVPTDEYDIKLNKIVTDKEVLIRDNHNEKKKYNCAKITFEAHF